MVAPLPAGDFEFLFVDNNGNGILLNSDVSPSQAFVDVTEVVGLDNSPFRETFRDHEGVDGGFLDAEFEKGRDVLITGVIYSPTGLLETYLDQLKRNYAPRTSNNRLYFFTPGVGVRFINCKSRGMRYDWEQSRRTGTMKVQFGLYAEDPRIYSYPSLATSLGWTAGPVEGFGFNYGFNFGFGVAPATLYDQVHAYNDGNRAAPVIITITGPGINPRVLNDTNGGEVLTGLTLLNGDTLTLDMLNHLAILNGTANRRNAVLVDNWFLLEPGDNVVRFQLEGGGGTVGVTSMALSWNGAWR